MKARTRKQEGREERPSGELDNQRIELEMHNNDSEDRYRIAIERSNDGVAIVCGDRHVFVNKQFLDIFGYERMEEAIGKPVSLTVHPDDRERVMQINRGRQKNQPVPSIYKMKGMNRNWSTARTIF